MERDRAACCKKYGNRRYCTESCYWLDFGEDIGNHKGEAWGKNILEILGECKSLSVSERKAGS